MAADGTDGPERSRRLSRRGLLIGGTGAVAVAAGAGTWAALRDDPTEQRISPGDEAVLRREEQRHRTGRVVTAALTAGAAELDLAGRTAATWAYDERVPGPGIHCRAGDELRVRLTNRLPDPTTVHWHGLAIRNDMDGVPHLVQHPVPPGGQYEYSFVVPDPGTYWLHAHMGMQRDRGLYAPLIVDDPDDPGDYDQDLTLMLDDWLDGLGYTPTEVLDDLKGGRPTPIVRDFMDRSSPWGPMTGDVAYPVHLVNGRPPEDPPAWTARPGQRPRIRLINASGDTIYRVSLGGHRLTVTHADGYPVRPVTVDTVLVGHGERYDVTTTLGDGVFPLVAAAEGKDALARALIRTGAGGTPAADVRPSELTGQVLTYGDLRPAGHTLPDRSPDSEVTLRLSRDPDRYRWLINGRAYDMHAPFSGTRPVPVHEGQRVRVTFDNASPMAHPMHVHGHTFALVGAGAGTRKDVVVVPSGQRVAVDIEADNPGQWLTHCHNAYHMATGMATVLSYLH